MSFTIKQSEYIISAKASFDKHVNIYAHLTSPKWVEETGEPILSMSFEKFCATISGFMHSKTPNGWPDRIAQERELRKAALLNTVQYANLHERIAKLSEIANSMAANSATKIAALRAIHDMMSEDDRNAALKQSGPTITIPADRVEHARRFLN